MKCELITQECPLPILLSAVDVAAAIAKYSERPFFEVNNDALGEDPAFGHRKMLYLELVDADGLRYRVVATEGERLTLNLEKKKLVKALYGLIRFEERLQGPALRDGLLPARVVCLSLESRPDRWTAFSNSFRRSSLLAGLTPIRHRARLPREMIIPDYWKHLPSYYATRADFHVMLDDAYGAGCNSLLIFEDDSILVEEFDLLYEAACRDLPEDWMGLWLGGHRAANGQSNHMRPPEPLTENLLRLRGTATTHAVLLSRRGMRRVQSHLRYHFQEIADSVTMALHGVEPNFFITPRDAVICTGDRTDARYP